MAWIRGTPAQLLKELRPGGWLMGATSTSRFPVAFSLHKGDFITDLQKHVDPAHELLWEVRNPKNTGLYHRERRMVVVWFGG